MIVLREVTEDDIPGLERLSSIAAERPPGFLNVPSDPEGWREKISFSQHSFAGKLESPHAGKYIFVAEDTESKHVVGISMAASQHGTKDSPHFYFEVGHEQKFSQTINTGFIHGTLSLKIEYDGPTEIGGLLVDPESRNTPDRVGRQISFVRFLYIGAHRTSFRDHILAELLPPLTKKGKSPLWEAVGRRFTNMDYWEADYLSSKNKEFILSLFPSGTIYVTFLPADARNSIGKVSKETEPVMHMLKKVGFKYLNQVDPFDGGPHLVARTDEVTPIQKVAPLAYGGTLSESGESETDTSGIASPKDAKPFRALSVRGVVKNGALYTDHPGIKSYLGLKPGDAVLYMPYY